jgi:hypothetical protein
MTNMVMWIAGLSAMVGGTLRFVRARRQLSPGAVYLGAAILFVGIAAVLLAPGTLMVGSHVEPFPNAERLVADILGMIAAWCVHALLIHLVGDDANRARAAVARQTVILVVAAVAMTVLLVTARIPFNPDFVSAFAERPGVLGFLLLFCAYIGWSAGNFVRLIRRYLRLTDRPWLQVGLVVSQVGAGFGVAWAIGKSVAALIVFATGRPLGLESAMSPVLAGLCVGLIAIGATVPTAGPAALRVTTWATHHYAYRALRPLRQLLSPVLLYIESAGGVDVPDSRSILERLSNRVIAVRDALLFLAPYRDAELGAAARNVSKRDPEAAAEATELGAALRAWQSGAAPITMTPPPPPRRVDDLDAETAWLLRVARAYRRSTTATGDVAIRKESSGHP